RAIEIESLDGTPVGPVDVDFDIPIRGWPVGDAGGDGLGVFEVGRGGGGRGSGVSGVAAILHRGKAAVGGAQGPLLDGLPEDAGVEAGGIAAALEFKIVIQ